MYPKRGYWSWPQFARSRRVGENARLAEAGAQLTETLVEQ